MKSFNFAVFAATALAATAVSFAGGLHFAGRANIGYNSFWNTDVSYTEEYEEDSYYKDVDEVEYSGLDKASGVGFGFGGAMRAEIMPSLDFQAELMISRRSRTTSDLSATATEYEYRFNNETSSWDLYDMETDGPDYLNGDVSLTEWFIDVPLLLRYSTNMGVFFNAGPVVSINISAEGEYSGISLDVGDFTTTFVFGAEIGAGYAIKLANNQQLDIDLRLHLGLSPLVSSDITYMGKNLGDGTKYGNPKDFNIMVGVSYWFM